MVGRLTRGQILGLIYSGEPLDVHIEFEVPVVDEVTGMITHVARGGMTLGIGDGWSPEAWATLDPGFFVQYRNLRLPIGAYPFEVAVSFRLTLADFFHRRDEPIVHRCKPLRVKSLEEVRALAQQRALPPAQLPQLPPIIVNVEPTPVQIANVIQMPNKKIEFVRGPGGMLTGAESSDA